MANKKQVKKSKAEIATIDCNLITIETSRGEFGFDTANKLEVEPQVEEQDAVKLVVKGILRAQKPKESTLTGHQLTLSDNVFNPELVLILQGGKIIYDPENPDEIVGYTPPVTGSAEKGEVFKLNAYTAQYDASGQIVKYEKMSYPNCQGIPVAFNSEDGAFRAPEYTINSAPKTGEAPYALTYVKNLPVLVDSFELGELTVTVATGDDVNKAKVTVEPDKVEFADEYMVKTDSAEITLPAYGEVPNSSFTPWNGKDEIAVTTGNYVAVVECSGGKAIAAGQSQFTA